MKKIKTILALVLSAVLMLTAVTVTSFADQYDSAAKITSGKAVSGELEKGDTVLYRLTAKKEGTLSVEYSAGIRWLELRVIDEDGASLTVDTMEQKVGSIIAGGADDVRIDTEWDSNSEKVKVIANFTVKKGTYYIKLWSPSSYNYGFSGSNTDKGSYKLTATYPSKAAADEKEFSYLGITLKKGATMQLEAVNADAKSTKWTSSKKTVATVSSTGKIKAKKKGTTVITCTSGDVVVKLKVTVK